VKRFLSIMTLVALALALGACASKPEPPPPGPAIESKATFEVLQHAGTVLGVTNAPGWTVASLDGPKAIERLEGFSGKYVVVVDTTGTNLEGTKLAASRLTADPEIARFLSIRVQDTFAGAQVGDKDTLETYFERVVKSVSDARFSGFRKESEWWIQLRWYKPDAKKTWDRDEYRVMQLWTIDKAVLDEQLRKILDRAGEEEPKTEEKARAIELAKDAFSKDF